MTDYYIEIVEQPFQLHERFWRVDGDTAHRDLAPSEIGTHTAEAGEDILTIIRSRYPEATFHKLMLGPGEYFPRMARPGSTGREHSPGHYPDESPAAVNTRSVSTGQLHALILELQQICRVIQPVPENFATYGIEVRNFLIIACTEVEAQWKNILKANGARAEARRDYVKLSPALKLPEYRVALPWYPWLDSIAPFKDWRPMPGTERQVLPWYDAYNATKHDRENAFAQATLENALMAVTACFVMLCAQYGWSFARRRENTSDAFFQLIEAPTWAPSEVYLGGQAATPRPYPF